MGESLESPVDFDIRDKLSQIKCPTLVLHERDDPVISFQDHVKPIEMQIYHSVIKQFKGLAHNTHLLLVVVIKFNSGQTNESAPTVAGDKLEWMLFFFK